MKKSTHEKILAIDGMFKILGMNMTMLRNHLQALSLALERTNTGVGPAVVTRLQNHIKAMDGKIKSPLPTYDLDVVPEDLVDRIETTIVSSVLLTIQANAMTDGNPLIRNCCDALTDKTTNPLKKAFYLHKAREIAPTVMSWIDITELSQELLEQIHETIRYLYENRDEERYTKPVHIES